MPNYQQGKIYAIRTHLNPDEFYIGSTAQEYLCTRFQDHLRNYKKGINKCNSKLLFDKYGVENCYIELIENYPCNSKDELRMREGFYQRQYIGKGSINKKIECRTKKEYRKDNKEKIAEYKKVYYETKKEQIAEYKKEYRQKHKEKINEKVICECGCESLKRKLERHKKTKKHLELMKTSQINSQKSELNLHNIKVDESLPNITNKKNHTLDR